ncbi:metal-dependent hydrolase [bacterium]|nr:metal-dependent hydrolase [bacterium]
MVKLTFLGHSAFMLESPKGIILIDPFISGNPQATCKADDLNPQWILVTHGHGDHLGDAISIAKRSDALLIAPFELASYVQKSGVNAHPMHIGGGHAFPFGKVKLTPALHGSAVEDEHGMVYTGQPCGFLVELEGKWIYHAGDTALFGDMELIGKRYNLDVALLPIGDNFTMGPDDAAYAVKLLKPKVVIPMHYNTWELIAQDPLKFAEKIDPKITRTVILKSGESYTIDQ